MKVLSVHLWQLRKESVYSTSYERNLMLCVILKKRTDVSFIKWP